MAIILDAHAARSCPVKTHNAHDRTVTPPGRQPDEALQELFDGGRDHREETLDRLALTPGTVDLRELAEDLAAAREATLRALHEGAAVVIRPQLPPDVDGHRKGSPDAVVRAADTAEGSPGYRPVQVKRHRILEMSGAADHVQQCSPLGAAGAHFGVKGMTVKASREGDLLQLAHYWRLLEATGFACGGEPTAGLIGTDALPGGAARTVPAIAWVELTRKFLRTFSRTSATGWTQRSALERYDHEFGFRVKVAQVASQRDGSPDDPRPMVSPIVIRECDHCTWWEACKPQLGEDDLSLRINKSPLDVREISVLRSHGINTLADLANTDVEALMASYLPEVRHRSGADSRLRLAARRATLMLAGVELERLTSDPIELPPADLEIDFDIETSAGDRVYLWGFWIDDRLGGGAPSYHQISRFEEMDNQSETALAIEAIEWMDRICTERPGVRIYHYSDYEVVHLLRLARRSADPEVIAAAQRVRGHFVDMFTLVKEHFFGTLGLGLKVVARSGPGFQWRDEDPGGLNSQTWFEEAVHGPDEATRSRARTRVLEYNEDDVRATHALRAWLRSLDESA